MLAISIVKTCRTVTERVNPSTLPRCSRPHLLGECRGYWKRSCRCVELCVGVGLYGGPEHEVQEQIHSYLMASGVLSNSSCGDYFSFFLGFLGSGVRSVLRILSVAKWFFSIALLTNISRKNTSLASIGWHLASSYISPEVWKWSSRNSL